MNYGWSAAILLYLLQLCAVLPIHVLRPNTRKWAEIPQTGEIWLKTGHTNALGRAAEGLDGLHHAGKRLCSACLPSSASSAGPADPAEWSHGWTCSPLATLTWANA